MAGKSHVKWSVFKAKDSTTHVTRTEVTRTKTATGRKTRVETDHTRVGVARQ